MTCIEEGKSKGAPPGIAVVTERESDKALGVVTDGDIRRALISDKSLEDSVGDIMSEDPFRIRDATGATEMLKQVHSELDARGESENKYQHILIVDEDDSVLDVVTPFELWKRSEIRINTATVQGLGYVGLTLALTLADNGITVHGVEKDPNKLEALASGTPHFYEQGLESLLQEHLGDDFHVSDSINGSESDIFIMCVNTPVTEDGEFDSTYIRQAAAEVGQNLAVHDLVVVRSTVLVGTCRETLVPILEEESGLVAGQDFFVAYAPERTVAGNALEELKTLPQVIGGINKRSVDYASQVFQMFSKNTIPVSSLETAEMVKLLNNCYRDVIFSFANETAQMCDHWDLDTHEVIQAANQGYSRNQIPKPSPGVGGPCLTKDPYLMVASGDKRGYKPKLPTASRNINQSMTDLVSQNVRDFCGELSGDSPTLFLMGMAYKGEPETSDIRNSPSMDIYRELSAEYDDIRVYDPVVEDDQLAEIGASVVERPADGFDGADGVLVLTNHGSFSNLDIYSLSETMANPGLLFDPWSLFNKEEVASHVWYDRFSAPQAE